MDGCEDCAPIEVATWDEYDKLLLQLEGDGATVDPWPHRKVEAGTWPQLWEGMSGIFADGRVDDAGADLGRVATRFVDGEGWVETWAIHDPEVRLRAAVRLPWLKHASPGEVLADVQGRPDADEYRVLTFAFRYVCPPAAEAIDDLPTVVPPFVTDVLRFRVFLTEDGIEQEAGALYRERMDIPPGGSVPPGIRWQDTWALWDNFDAPSPAPEAATGREVRLEATSWGGEAVRDFLDEQLTTLPGHCVVRTHSDVAPLP